MSGRLVGVRLGWYGPLRYYDAADSALSSGERVIVSGAEGESEGVVVIAPSQLMGSEVPLEVAGTVRRVEGGRP